MDIPQFDPLTTTDPLPLVARKIWAQEIQTVIAYEPEVRQAATIKGVHESRKAMRRLRTSFKLFAPYFQPDALRPFNRTFRRTMRRLGPARDLAVFSQKLDAYRQQDTLPPEHAPPLNTLATYITQQRLEADNQAKLAFTHKRYQTGLPKFLAFLHDTNRHNQTYTPMDPHQIRHILPILLYQKIAYVRAYDGHVATCSDTELHQLRIEFKQLRYTLRFFSPLLDTPETSLLKELKQHQELLGDFNDASVALDFLTNITIPDDNPLLIQGINLYQTVQKQQLIHLRQQFLIQWNNFLSSSWFHNVATAVACL
ncbi:MAG TPA: CHAD domain-containing protein [Anaerolineae bacterium]|nr:CHAD domain-containing protein [Anaerolineae bacterium]